MTGSGYRERRCPGRSRSLGLGGYPCARLPIHRSVYAAWHREERSARRHGVSPTRSHSAHALEAAATTVWRLSLCAQPHPSGPTRLAKVVPQFRSRMSGPAGVAGERPPRSPGGRTAHSEGLARAVAGAVEQQLAAGALPSPGFGLATVSVAVSGGFPSVAAGPAQQPLDDVLNPSIRFPSVARRLPCLFAIVCPSPSRVSASE